MSQELLHRPVRISAETELIRAAFGFFFLLLVCFIMGADSSAEENSPGCFSLVKPLDQKRKEVESGDGIWGIYARSSAMDKHSKEAVKLDSNISKIIETLDYLCATQSGVPFNELASFVTRKISELGEESFKRNQIHLGKPKKDVEDWLKYSRIARANEKRLLKLDKVKTSIQGASVFINRYWKLFHDYKNQNNVDSILPATVKLNQDIGEFMTTDPYTALALFEDSQIPYWDVDENYGGS